MSEVPSLPLRSGMNVMEFTLRRSCVMLLILIMSNDVIAQHKRENEKELQMLADHVFYLSEVMLHDVASPPAAGRVYAYAMLSAYQVASMVRGRPSRLNQKLHADPRIPMVNPPKKVDLAFCSNYALLEAGRQLMPSGHLLESKKHALVEDIKSSHRFSDREITQQVRFATDVAGQVINYARGDGYNKLSTFTRYTPRKGDGFWFPTPPAYMGAVEPQWATVRPFYLDSASQFAPPPPAPFSKDTTSSFFKQLKEVYDVTRNLTDEQRAIANFWDCNPFNVAFSGHIAIGLKKISPGGHWMGITGIACKKANLSLDSAIFVHTVVATTLHDAFVSCWQEKFNSDRIRPETAINKYLDPDWRALLQTPPFPEYSSGHSVVSGSASVVLTRLLGDNFSFVDTSEVYFGLPERKFNSFREAAEEAAMSRLYSGIHFRDACEEGLRQGRRVGQYVLSRLADFQP